MHSHTWPSRRGVLTGLAATAAGTALSACGPKTPGGGTTLNMWGGVPPENGPNDVIAAFEKKHPKLKVKYHRYVNDPQGNVKLDTALQGGAPIDVYFSYGLQYLAQRVKSGLAADLTDRVQKDQAFTSLADPERSEAVWFDGKLHSLVCARDPHLVFVNQDLLAEAGVTIPEKWTIDDFTKAAEAIAGKNRYGMLFYPDTPRITLGADNYYARGGRKSRFADPAYREYGRAWRDALDKKIAFPYEEVVAQKLDVYQHTPFLQGKVGLWIASTFNTRYISDTKEFPRDFKVSALPMPRVPGEKYWNPGFIGNDICINPKTRHKEAAWDLARFWMIPDGSVPMIKGGRVPYLLDGIDDETIMKELLGKDREKVYDVESVRRVLLDKDTRIPVDTVATGYAGVYKAFMESRAKMLLGETSVDDWVTTLKKRADQAIAKDS
ncbi:extracellular solute-binding protein [Streptomyces sp. A7024]|uniref:Extracellular solute-binding protein n=1 Tax=Streptomyces coryli TaxID=1128680 RepID=A0A6G4TTW2_9ACTN|nr:extracellular solute-binding protein [Streptomyces coryli]NGN62538.1 extracellular solute-binding protein [Streptomyces coryli]